jgi:hypothetical protein
MKKVNKLKDTFLPMLQDGGPVDPKSLEGDIIAKILLNRNQSLNTVQRLVRPNDYPELVNKDGSVSTHLMQYFHDGPKAGAYMEPTLFYGEEGVPALTRVPNIGEEVIGVPNNYAEYISSRGYKRAASDLKQSVPKLQGGGDILYNSPEAFDMINKLKLAGSNKLGGADQNMLSGAMGADPYTGAIKMAADKIKKKQDQILGGVSTAGSVIYGAGNMPGEYSDMSMSKLGMGLQGASLGAKVGGLPGAALGYVGGAALGWYTAKKNNVEKEEQDYLKEMAYINNSVRSQDKGIPMAKDGGKIKEKFEDTSTFFSQLVKDKNKYIILKPSSHTH